MIHYYNFYRITWNAVIVLVSLVSLHFDNMQYKLNYAAFNFMKPVSQYSSVTCLFKNTEARCFATQPFSTMSNLGHKLMKTTHECKFILISVVYKSIFTFFYSLKGEVGYCFFDIFMWFMFWNFLGTMSN